MIRVSEVRRCGRLPAILTVAFLVAAPSLQGAIPFPKRPTDTTPIEKMRKGDLVVDAKNKEHLSELAKWLADRLVHPPFNGEEPKKKAAGQEDLESLMADAERYFTWPNPRQMPNNNQMDYGRELGKEMAAELMFVMNETDKPLEKVNAARMLALAGKLPCEELGDVYLKIIREDKYPDQIKLFAFQGLRNLLTIPDHRYAGQHFMHETKDKFTLADIYTELEKYITTKYPPGMPLEEALVKQFIRREAVRAMAQFKHCVLVNQKKQVVGKPVWVLIRVARNDPSIMPGYNFGRLERIEALFGICSMQPDNLVNNDAIAYLVNETLYEMTGWIGEDKGEFQKDPRNKPSVPWRIIGYRGNETMNLWKANMEKEKPNRNPKAALDLADLATVKFFSKLVADGVNAVPDIRSFASWRSDRRPKDPKVVVDDPSTSIGGP